MESFSFEIKPKEYYDFLCGRVKILETYLIPESNYKDLVSKDFMSFVETLMAYPYRNFIIGSNFYAVRDGIYKRRDAEFEEFGKFELAPFINVFFRSSDYFLLVKKYAVGESVSEDFADFLEGRNENYPVQFRECFLEFSKETRSYIKPLVIDKHYSLYMLKNAKLTKSDFIVDFYKKFFDNSIIVTLIRNYKLFKNGFLNEAQFNEVIAYLKEAYPQSPFLNKIKTVGTLSELLEGRVAFYGEKNLSEYWATLLRKTLEDVFDQGKFLNEGIEPIFVYLLKLNYEVSILQNIAYALYFGINPKEIEALEFIYE